MSKQNKTTSLQRNCMQTLPRPPIHNYKTYRACPIINQTLNNDFQYFLSHQLGFHGKNTKIPSILPLANFEFQGAYAQIGSANLPNIQSIFPNFPGFPANTNPVSSFMNTFMPWLATNGQQQQVSLYLIFSIDFVGHFASFGIRLKVFYKFLMALEKFQKN